MYTLPEIKKIFDLLTQGDILNATWKMKTCKKILKFLLQSKI